MAFINHKIYSLPDDFQRDLHEVLAFVEDWNKQDANKEVAAAAGRIGDILQACDDEQEKSDIVDTLTSEQEDKLKEEHMKEYHGDKDHYENSYENFLADLPLEDLKRILV